MKYKHQTYSPGEIRAILYRAVEEYHPPVAFTLEDHLANLRNKIDKTIKEQQLENKLSWVIDAYRDHRLNQETIESLIKDLTGVICE